MKAVLLLGLFSCLFALVSKYRKRLWGLKISFLLIFLFLALRYQYGNDYNTYFVGYTEISQHDLFDISYDALGFEIGWMYLNQLCRPIGFFGMVAVLAAANCLIYYNFIKKFVPLKYHWLAVLFYIFNPECMLVQASAMRQTIAILLFLLSIQFLYKKDIIRYSLCITLATFFHLSAVVLFPLYFLGFIRWRINKPTAGILIALFSSMFIFRESLGLQFRGLIRVLFEKYEIYEAPGQLNTGLGIVYGIGLFSVSLFWARTRDPEIELVGKIGIIGLMLIPLNLILELFSRVGFYFAPATLVVYTIILSYLGSPYLRVLILVLLFSITGWKFYGLMYSDVNREHYEVYQTILSAHGWY